MTGGTIAHHRRPACGYAFVMHRRASHRQAPARGSWILVASGLASLTALVAASTTARAVADAARLPAPQAQQAQPPAGWPGPVYDNTPAGQIGGTSKAMVVADGRAWIGYGPRLAELDVSDPAKPRLVRASEVLADVVSAVATDGSRVYVAAGRTVYVFLVE